MSKTRKEQIEELLLAEPDDPFLRYGLAMEYVSAGDDEGAVGCFQELLARAPEYVSAYMQIGQALVRLGRLEDARQQWSRGIPEARRQGDQHAADEMQGFLSNLE